MGLTYDYVWDNGEIDNIDTRLDNLGKEGYHVIYFKLKGYKFQALLERSSDWNHAYSTQLENGASARIVEHSLTRTKMDTTRRGNAQSV